MSFLANEDIELDNIIEDVISEMKRALEQIEVCDATQDRPTEWNTTRLKKDIERFIEDYS